MGRRRLSGVAPRLRHPDGGGGTGVELGRLLDAGDLDPKRPALGGQRVRLAFDSPPAAGEYEPCKLAAEAG